MSEYEEKAVDSVTEETFAVAFPCPLRYRQYRQRGCCYSKTGYREHHGKGAGIGHKTAARKEGTERKGYEHCCCSRGIVPGKDFVTLILFPCIPYALIEEGAVCTGKKCESGRSHHFRQGQKRKGLREGNTEKPRSHRNSPEHERTSPPPAISDNAGRNFQEHHGNGKNRFQGKHAHIIQLGPVQEKRYRHSAKKLHVFEEIEYVQKVQILHVVYTSQNTPCMKRCSGRDLMTREERTREPEYNEFSLWR